MNNDHRLFVSQRKVKIEQSSIRNHLLSIVRDRDFVELVQSVFPDIPCVANERNGMWYCPGTPSCYFKSTDGHDGQWDFSLSRMNLDFARQAMRKGALLVDSTRRGKRFPDSLSVTVPIWIAVINSIVFGKVFSLDAPPWISSSHVEQISRLIPSWIESVSDTVKTMIRQLLCDQLLRPFQPVWVCGSEDQSLEWYGAGADSLLEGDESTSLSFTPLILLSCSTVTSDDMHSQHHSWQYIQGAGDDEEAWAQGLSPTLFWQHKEFILASDDYREVEAAVEHVVTHHKPAQGSKHGQFKYMGVTGVTNDDDTHLLPVQLYHIGQSGIYIMHSCTSVNDAVDEIQRRTGQVALSGVIEIIPHCGNTITGALESSTNTTPLLQIHATLKQPRSHFSTVSIPAVIAFYNQLLKDNNPDDTVLLAIVDHVDGTMAYTVAMAILLEFFNSSSLDFLQCERTAKHVEQSKGDILDVLTALQIHIPQVRIPRALMKELNAYFVATTCLPSDR